MKLSAANLSGQISAISGAVQNIWDDAEGFLQAVNGFVNDGNLTGNRYENAKGYFQEKYQPLARGLILGCQELMAVNVVCSSWYSIWRHRTPWWMVL